MRKNKNIWGFVLGLVLCLGCSQAVNTALIKDGSEAASLAGLEIAQAQLPAVDYNLLVKGLDGIDTTAIGILNNTTSTLTLEQVIELAFSSDPDIAQYAAIVEYALPVLTDVLGSTALSTAVNKLSSADKAYALAFFQGQQIACQDAPTTTSATLLANNPKLAKAAQKLGIGKFDPAVLINKLKVVQAAKAAAMKAVK